MLLPMNQLSEKRILCFSYTCSGNASGKLPGMNVVISDSGSFLYRQNFAGVVGRSGNFSVIGKWSWRSKHPGVDSVVSTPRRSPRTSCNICKSSPLVFANVPAMAKTISGRAMLVDAETPMASRVFRIGVGFHFVHSLNKPLEKSCQAAAMTGLESKFSGCRSAGSRSDRLAGAIHRPGFTEQEQRLCAIRTMHLRKPNSITAYVYCRRAKESGRCRELL